MNETTINRDRQFDVIVKVQEGHYVLRTPGWPLFVEGPDLKEAFDNLCAQRSGIINKYKAAGLAHELTSSGDATFSNPAGIAPPHTPSSGFSRTILGVICLGVVLGLFAILFIRMITAVPDRIRNYVAAATPQAVGKATIDAIVHTGKVLQEFTPERKAELLQGIQAIIREVQPIAHEISPLLTELYPPAACPQASSTSQARALTRN